MQTFCYSSGFFGILFTFSLHGYGIIISFVKGKVSMVIGKGAYLKQLTAATAHMKSVAVGKEIEGSSPPSVFIGSWNYPDVYAGPMIAPMHGDTAIMDQPES
jgi:hypothetical protein